MKPVSATVPNTATLDLRRRPQISQPAVDLQVWKKEESNAEEPSIIAKADSPIVKETRLSQETEKRYKLRETCVLNIFQKRQRIH